jgi:hypothetical protein
MTRVGMLLLVALLSAACTITLDASPEPSPQVCDSALLEGELLSDDGTGFIVRHEEGFVTPVTWPGGYAVREADVRELLDSAGRVVAREGDLVALAGGMGADDVAFVVCGTFTVTPRD